MKKKRGFTEEEKALMEEEADLKRDISEEDIDEDMPFRAQSKMYPSDILPQDFYQYKKMRLIPDASTDFAGMVDKDLVLANVGGEKPNLHKLKFLVGTLELVNNVFVVEKDITIQDNEGRVILGKDNKPFIIRKMVFDETFEPIRRYLLSDFKTLLAGSRAMGGDREAVLDITTTLRKDIARRKEKGDRRTSSGWM